MYDTFETWGALGTTAGDYMDTVTSMHEQSHVNIIYFNKQTGSPDSFLLLAFNWVSKYFLTKQISFQFNG